ncbi:MAG: S-layer homology domain-containing protein [Armatimonadetes bacterium]|nr:S-layer homology domain-containing protein [Armatimonadota bacterium]
MGRHRLTWWALFPFAFAAPCAAAEGATAPALPSPPYIVRPVNEPRQPATRYVVCAMIAETFRITGDVVVGEGEPQPFRDVPAAHWAARKVDAMRRAGLARGFPDGNFLGDGAVTRYEFAGLFWSTLLEPWLRQFPGAAPNASPRRPEPFPDVTPDSWSYLRVERLRRWGIIEGYPDGTFMGRRVLTHGELQLCLERAAALFAGVPAAVPPGLAPP